MLFTVIFTKLLSPIPMMPLGRLVLCLLAFSWQAQAGVQAQVGASSALVSIWWCVFATHDSDWKYSSRSAAVPSR